MSSPPSSLRELTKEPAPTRGQIRLRPFQPTAKRRRTCPPHSSLPSEIEATCQSSLPSTALLRQASSQSKTTAAQSAAPISPQCDAQPSLTTPGIGFARPFARFAVRRALYRQTVCHPPLSAQSVLAAQASSVPQQAPDFDPEIQIVSEKLVSTKGARKPAITASTDTETPLPSREALFRSAGRRIGFSKSQVEASESSSAFKSASKPTLDDPESREDGQGDNPNASFDRACVSNGEIRSQGKGLCDSTSLGASTRTPDGLPTSKPPETQHGTKKTQPAPGQGRSSTSSLSGSVQKRNGHTLHIPSRHPPAPSPPQLAGPPLVQTNLSPRRRRSISILRKSPTRNPLTPQRQRHRSRSPPRYDRNSRLTSSTNHRSSTPQRHTHQFRSPSPLRLSRSRAPSRKRCRSFTPSRRMYRSLSPSPRRKRSRTPPHYYRRRPSPSLRSHRTRDRSRTPLRGSYRHYRASKYDRWSLSPSRSISRSRTPSRYRRRSRSPVRRTSLSRSPSRHGRDHRPRRRSSRSASPSRRDRLSHRSPRRAPRSRSRSRNGRRSRRSSRRTRRSRSRSRNGYHSRSPPRRSSRSRSRSRRIRHSLSPPRGRSRSRSLSRYTYNSGSLPRRRSLSRSRSPRRRRFRESTRRNSCSRNESRKSRRSRSPQHKVNRSRTSSHHSRSRSGAISRDTSLSRTTPWQNHSSRISPRQSCTPPLQGYSFNSSPLRGTDQTTSDPRHVPSRKYRTKEPLPAQNSSQKLGRSQPEPSSHLRSPVNRRNYVPSVLVSKVQSTNPKRRHDPKPTPAWLTRDVRVSKNSKEPRSTKDVYHTTLNVPAVASKEDLSNCRTEGISTLSAPTKTPDTNGFRGARRSVGLPMHMQSRTPPMHAAIPDTIGEAHPMTAATPPLDRTSEKVTVSDCLNAVRAKEMQVSNGLSRQHRTSGTRVSTQSVVIPFDPF